MICDDQFYTTLLVQKGAWIARFCQAQCRLYFNGQGNCDGTDSSHHAASVDAFSPFSLVIEENS
jgi:hypothetical protein